MSARIVLTCIIKDDSEFDKAEEMLKSFMPYFHGLVVAFTGVSGKFDLVEKLFNQWGGHVIKTSPQTHPDLYLKGEKGYVFANFAKARQLTLELAEKLKFDFISWADADDLLVGGKELQTVANLAKEQKIDAVYFTYWYSVVLRSDKTFDETCVQIEHLRERLFVPGKFKWVSRLHEVTVPKEDGYKPVLTEYTFNLKEGRRLVWAHITTKERSMSNLERNKEILEAQIKEEQSKDPRTVFYLAKTYYDINDPKLNSLGMLLLDEYLHGKYKSGWAEERANAWQYYANFLSRANKHQEAIDALHLAIKEFPNNHLNFLYLAREYELTKYFEMSDFWLEIALRMDPPRVRTTIGNPLEVKYTAASLQYNRALRRMQLDEAIKWLQVTLQLGGLVDPGMLNVLKDAKYLNDTANDVLRYAKWLKDKGHTQKLIHLLESLPIELGRERFAHFIANEVMPPKTWDEKSVVYFASWGTEHFEKWSPKNIDSGIGGSETAVIELSQKFAKHGYKVTVFGDPREDEGKYNGVDYRAWYEINWKDTFNIIIFWRSPYLLDRDIKAKKILYDAHDIEAQTNWTDQRIKKVNKAFFKSNYHRGMVPKLPDEKVKIVSNGI